jgi:putative hydrolase of HD superfamily
MKKADLFAFFETLEKLKRTPRTGWVERGVKDPESVSDHSFRMTVMAMALAEELDC